ncbi:hypothetical protein [uncultured Gammaproteobacteria bacterium]|nr:hypothetical protein [uncultured Gammaproteobacteria bacterium]
MKTSVQFIVTIATISFLSACGSGGSSDDGDIKTGQFKDSAVKGLSYETATQNGTTDEKGTFKYKAGEAVTFKIGEMVIGRTTGADVLYPTHITDSKPAAVKVAQVLQTLDKDGNPDNGIDIERQFKLEFTRNEDIQEVSSLQDLVTSIKATDRSSLTLVGNIQAEKHMDATIFSDVHPTFESISTQEALNRLKISDGKLEIMPESTSAVNDRNIWLLAQSDSKITSISADVQHGYEGNYSSMTKISLILELKTTKNVHYFSISADTFVCDSSYCNSDGKSEGMLTVVTGGSQSNHNYLGEIIKVNSSGYSYKKQENITSYTGEKLEEVTMGGDTKGEFTDYKFSIKIDKQNKKVLVAKGNFSGFFDISNAVFGNLNNASVKFFIKHYSTNRSNASRNDDTVVPFNSSYIDNVKINNQDFDDFSASTLNTNKWKTGKFSYLGY